MNTNKISIPSFEVERCTQALNKSLYGFVGLISMFTVGVVVFASHLMFAEVFNITSTFMSDNMSLILVPTMFFAVIFGIGIFNFWNLLLHSYEISSEKIVKGRIVKGRMMDLNQIIANAPKTGRVKKIIFAIIKLISYNMKQSFVDEFFHTDIYKKKEYLNPQLIKETKHYYVYRCDNQKKVKIHKIYTGMLAVDNSKKHPSMIKRVITRSLLVMLTFALLSTVDLVIGANNNEENIGNIHQTVSEIERNLEEFGYTAKKYNEKTYYFEKKASSSRTSHIKYSFNVKGEIEDVDFEVYYNSNSLDMSSELEYIISSTTKNFSDAEILAFIENVQRTIDGEFAYDKLGSIVLGTSGGHAHIHN